MKIHKLWSDLEHILSERISKPARVARFIFVLSFLPAYCLWVLQDGLSWKDALPFPAALLFGLTQLLGWRKRPLCNRLSLVSGCALIILVITATGAENSPFLFLLLLPILSYGLEKNCLSTRWAMVINGSYYGLLIILALYRGNTFALSYLTGILITGYAMERVIKHNLGFLEWQIHTLSKQALRDPLTGLLNRNALKQIASELMTRKIPFVLLIADLDNFKRYNDSRGHLAGDNLLRKVARVFQESFRSQDFIFRYGGDEFLILIPEGNRDLAEQLIKRLKQNLYLALEGEVGISCGFALFPQEASNLENLLQIADELLYREKARFSPETLKTCENDAGKKEED